MTVTGKGDYAGITSALGSATVTNCLFAGNRYLKLDGSSGNQYENAGHGCAIYGVNLVRTYIDDCTFVTNGVVFMYPENTFAGQFRGSAVCFRRVCSPAVNAGDPASDFSREYGDNGRRINLGYYGNTPWATMTPLKGDVLRVR